MPDSTFNLLHIPWDFRKKQYRRFAFINFINNEFAWAFLHRWVGRRLRDHGRGDPLDVRFANVQGLAAITELLRSQRGGRLLESNFMPAAFQGTERIEFWSLVGNLFPGVENLFPEVENPLASDAEGAEGMDPFANFEDAACVRWSL